MTIVIALLFAGLGFYLSYLGYTFQTKEYWIILSLVLAIQIISMLSLVGI